MADKSLVRFFQVGLYSFMHGLENAALNGLVSCRLYWSHLIMDFGIQHYLTCLTVLFCIRKLAKATLRKISGLMRKPCTAIKATRRMISGVLRKPCTALVSSWLVV